MPLTSDIRNFLSNDVLLCGFAGFSCPIRPRLQHGPQVFVLSPRGDCGCGRRGPETFLSFREAGPPLEPRPVVSIPLCVFCARKLLADLFRLSMSIFGRQSGHFHYDLVRWRAVFLVAFFGCLRRSEYLDSVFLSPCVEFDAASMAALRPLMDLPFVTMELLFQRVVAALLP